MFPSSGLAGLFRAKGRAAALSYANSGELALDALLHGADVDRGPFAVGRERRLLAHDDGRRFGARLAGARREANDAPLGRRARLHDVARAGTAERGVDVAPPIGHVGGERRLAGLQVVRRRAA